MVKVEYNNLCDFELAHIFECGQCFRWHKVDDENYIGVTKFGVLDVKKISDNKVIISGSDSENFEMNVKEYFDLNTDYTKIKVNLEQIDDNIKKAISYGYGIRILNQDPWEMLISFIISAANNIPRISKTIENISKAYGEEIIFNGEKYYKFPTPKELSKASIEDLRKLNLGFRDKYVYSATQMAVKHEINLDEILKKNYIDAKKELTKIDGVGEKVADCILLFSMKKKEAFPVDTWIKKVMSDLYNESKDIKKIASFANQKFGNYAGIAQQYLFYYMRNYYSLWLLTKLSNKSIIRLPMVNIVNIVIE